MKELVNDDLNHHQETWHPEDFDYLCRNIIHRHILKKTSYDGNDLVEICESDLSSAEINDLCQKILYDTNYRSEAELIFSECVAESWVDLIYPFSTGEKDKVYDAILDNFRRCMRDRVFEIINEKLSMTMKPGEDDYDELGKYFGEE